MGSTHAGGHAIGAEAESSSLPLSSEPDAQPDDAPTQDRASFHAPTAWIIGLSVCAIAASLLQVLLRDRAHGYFTEMLVFGVLIVGAWFDTTKSMIPNRLNYPALLIGLAIGLAINPLLQATGIDYASTWLGAAGWRQVLMGFGLCAGIGIAGFATRGLGGGDVKLMTAVGALLGFDAVVPVLVNTLMIAAVIGVINLAVKGKLVNLIQGVFLFLFESITTRKVAKPGHFGRHQAPFVFSLLGGYLTVPLFNVHEWVTGLPVLAG